MPQTLEAINHAKAAGVPIVVAVNKIDKADANPDYVKRQLADMGLVPDEWGGNTLVVPVSAKQKMGLEDLMEAILLTAEPADIRANPKGKVIGTVVEASVDRNKGVVATLLVQNGTLETGDTIVAGTAYGKLRAMFDFRGRKIRNAGPSTPVQAMGLNEVPGVGEVYKVYGSEREARVVVEERKSQAKVRAQGVPKASLEELFSKVQSGEEKDLRLIIKADVMGSLEPIVNSINELNSGAINVNVIYAETGNISENDVLLASASKAIILGFNVTADPATRRTAEAEGVSIRMYDIIYRLTEDLEKALKGMLAPEERELMVGKAEVHMVFAISKVGNIAGCKVLSGEMRRNGRIRVMRGEKKLFEGEMSSLKHLKDDVREVRTGFECGIGLRGFNDFAVGDILECVVIEKG
jgi:translation initiation factor IF-2